MKRLYRKIKQEEIIQKDEKTLNLLNESNSGNKYVL